MFCTIYPRYHAFYSEMNELKEPSFVRAWSFGCSLWHIDIRFFFSLNFYYHCCCWWWWWWWQCFVIRRLHLAIIVLRVLNLMRLTGDNTNSDLCVIGNWWRNEYFLLCVYHINPQWFICFVQYVNTFKSCMGFVTESTGNRNFIRRLWKNK